MSKLLKLHDLYPLKAQFRSGETVELAAECHNPTANRQQVRIRLSLYKLDQLISREETVHPLPPNQTSTIVLQAGSYQEENAGFGAVAEMLVQGEEQDIVVQGEEQDMAVNRLSTAFDVVADWRAALRYGFLSDYSTDERGKPQDLQWMTKLHLNIVQFYDWMYRHDELVREDDSYVDLMGRVVDPDTVKEKVQLCHAYGMKAIAYGAVYAASVPFGERHPEWQLYTNSGQPLDFIGIFRLMNIAEDNPWHHHIIDQYEQAIRRMGFDGIHMDTYGYPKTAWSHEDYGPRLEQLEEQFPVLIRNTRERLGDTSEERGERCLIFNNVGNWPVHSVALAEQDAIYIEVWHPYVRYDHLREIIDAARRAGEGKPVILAAYLKPFREPGELGIAGAERAYRLLNAVVSAHGATHLLWGEDGGVLTQGYYVDHSIIAEDFRKTVRTYSDFGVRYGFLMQDRLLRNVTMTHAGGDNLEYQFSGFSHSATGEAGKVWTIIQERTGMKLIHFVNLCGQQDDRWNEAKEPLMPVSGRCVRILLDLPIRSIFVASPDRCDGDAVRVTYELEHTARGQVAVVTMPELHAWDMLVIICGD